MHNKLYYAFVDLEKVFDNSPEGGDEMGFVPADILVVTSVKDIPPRLNYQD